MSAELEDAKARNAALKATLSALQSRSGTAAPEKTEAQKKADLKLALIEKEAGVFQLQQEIEKQKMQGAHIAASTAALEAKLKEKQAEIDQQRNSGQASWEATGIKTVPYKDPFHTGLSKRTPTGGYFTS
eukprot:CAMPEP_0174718960 /NCGR_PEP_ID=MMETSP1094-20130205/30448_1 /TAXON_ID=156173 /ORGANISM="Chrysochromulina brevifilum, Strain UTEX LB 985" /LENGTH=129 /DNA_ID=CAMNT_0015919187 /DNA_START=33 /DNA_END=422 /DNA_ORIENTATION=-